MIIIITKQILITYKYKKKKNFEAIEVQQASFDKRIKVEDALREK